MLTTQAITPPRWPLIGSIVLHACLIGGFFLHPPLEHFSEVAAQSVELWAPDAAEEPEQTKNSSSFQANALPQPLTKTEITVEKRTISSPLSPSSLTLPSTHHTIEAALAKLPIVSSPPASSLHATNTNSMNLTAYKNQVIHRIRPYILIPPNLVGNPSAQIQVRLAPSSMEIIFVKLIKSSGNAEYDQSILQAVQKIGQFPPIPAQSNPAFWRSITLTFRPR